MTEDFDIEALRYLTGELNLAAHAEFEARLAREPGARAALKACRAGLAQFARETAPAEAMTPSTQRAALAAILATVAAEPRTRARNFPWRRFVWPLAASVLLVLNLVQYFRPVSLRPSLTPGALARFPTASSGNTPAGREGKIHPPGASQAEHPGLQTAASLDATVTKELHRLEKLRTEYATLERSREALNAEYNDIIRQLAQRALINKGVGRLAAMELVDAGSYARGERKGLVDLARGLLTEPGVVTIEPPPSPTPPVNPNASTNADPATPLRDPMANTLPDPTANTLPNPPPPPQVNPPPTPTGDPPQTAIQNKAEPYAWSVFDETSSQGYLNLYNLPATPADQSLQLWVKAANADTYQRVGEVPVQFYGGSGSLTYSLPSATQPPSDILITQEPRHATPTQPTGPTVLHGP